VPAAATAAAAAAAAADEDELLRPPLAADEEEFTLELLLPRSLATKACTTKTSRFRALTCGHSTLISSLPFLHAEAVVAPQLGY
jgi:hypothetical protein